MKVNCVKIDPVNLEVKYKDMDRKVEMYCPPMTSSGYSAAIYQFVESMEMDGNNLCASENTCHGKREIAFVDSENASPMNNTTVKATYIVSGDQMIGINLNLRAGTIPQSILTISSNAVGNIPGQFSANGVRLLPGIQRPPANDSHLVNQVQPDAASHRMSYGGFVYGQTSPTHLQLPTYANTGYEQPQQVQQASVNFSVPNHNATFPLLMDNGRIRYRNDQNQMIQLQRQVRNDSFSSNFQILTDYVLHFLSTEYDGRSSCISNNAE